MRDRHGYVIDRQMPTQRPHPQNVAEYDVQVWRQVVGLHTVASEADVRLVEQVRCGRTGV